jgi:serine/threonine-protein kinase
LVSGNFAFEQIDAALFHTCALVGGNAYCWGDNTYGQLGDGTKTARLTPVRVAPFP